MKPETESTNVAGAEAPTPVLILGGGYAALAAADTLGRAGVRSTILEAGAAVGGLAACERIGPVLVERAYHHIKPQETELISLIHELGLAERLKWADTRMGFHIDGETYPFSTPSDLLRFKPFTWSDKLRFGLGILRAKYLAAPPSEGMNAREWVRRHWSNAIHDRMLGPMLHNKFGLPSEDISAAFLHGRIRGIAQTKSNTGSGERMGYLSGSLQPLTERWIARVRAHTDIHLNAPIQRIERAESGNFVVHAARQEFRAPRVINTLPLEVFRRLLKNFPFHSQVRYQSAICGVFVVRECPMDLYWLNIIDPKIPFKVLVNQSRLDNYPETVLYCGNYLHADEPFYQLDDDEILRRYEEGLRTLFGKLSVLASRVFKMRHATPVFDREFARHTANLDGEVPGMIFAGNIKVYPHGRTLNNVLVSGRVAARTILAERAGQA